MSLTKAEVEAKILQTSEEMCVLTRKLDYWRQLLSVISNPLFAELSAETPGAPPNNTKPESSPVPIENGVPLAPQYGLLKRLTYELLQKDAGQAVTPQELAKRIHATGYVFRTKTPSISVNDTLNTLQGEGKARLIMRAANGAGLWVKDTPSHESRDWIDEVATEKEAPEGTS